MARSTREEKKTTEEQSIKNQIVWLLMQMGVVVNDIINIKQQITILGEKRSCQHEAIARNKDACRTPPHTTNTARALRSRSPQTPPTPPTTPPLSPLSPLPSISPRSTPAALSALPSLSPLSPVYSMPLPELIELLGPDFDFDLEIERYRYEKQ